MYSLPTKNVLLREDRQSSERSYRVSTAIKDISDPKKRRTGVKAFILERRSFLRKKREGRPIATPGRKLRPVLAIRKVLFSHGPHIGRGKRASRRTL